MPDPYLSLVVAARNDDHGGNLLGRMQIFVNGWLTQAQRYQIPSELIIVEWNPPADRPQLAEALTWPADLGPCEVRFIVVPREVHDRYQHAENLPLYQMIAKNVGIRRARGRFILATNIDILFSNELAEFLGAQGLRTDRMYRIDRYDAMSDVPAQAPLDEQLAYCRTHLIRVNRREGTFEVTPEGGPVLSAVDVASPGSGILLGQGWFAPERGEPMGCFRWAESQAEILLDSPPDSITRLMVDLEPGPATGSLPLELEVLTDGGAPVAHVTIESRTRMHLMISAPAPSRLVLRGVGTFVSPNVNPRTLCFRVFQIEREPEEEIESRAEPEPEAVAESKPETQRENEPESEPEVEVAPVVATATLEAIPTRNRVLGLWRQLQYVIQKLADGGPLVSLTVPVSPRLRRLLKNYVERGGFTGMLRGTKAPPSEPPATVILPPVAPEPQAPAPPAVEPEPPAPLAREPEIPAAVQSPPPESPKQICCADFLHTNGCGDFTLLAREHWFNLRGYPEFDIFSMNIDSVFCFAAHYGGAREEVLGEPMRIYHIEHGSGSGWTPEGQQKLYQRLAVRRIPVLDNEDVLQWAAQMRRLNSPMIFNYEKWGLLETAFQELAPQGSRRRAGPVLDPARLRVKPVFHPSFDRMSAYQGESEPGFEIDFLGIRTRCEFLAGEALKTMLPAVDPGEDYFEWIDILESILAAQKQFVIIELGAGYGRWSVRAAAALRQLRQLPFHLIAVEAEPQHYFWLQQHLSDNRIPLHACTLIQGVVSDHRHDVLFYVSGPSGQDEPASWYGQAIIKDYEEVDGPGQGKDDGREVFPLKSGWKAIKAHSYLLEDILPETGRIDLIDLDIQGEELKVISAAIGALNERVARLHIGTHSHEIEAGLRQLLGRNRWECTADYPCAQTNQTPWGPVDFVDGVQSWINPSRLRE